MVLTMAKTPPTFCGMYQTALLWWPKRWWWWRRRCSWLRHTAWWPDNPKTVQFISSYCLILTIWGYFIPLYRNGKPFLYLSQTQWPNLDYYRFHLWTIFCFVFIYSCIFYNMANLQTISLDIFCACCSWLKKYQFQLYG